MLVGQDSAMLLLELLLVASGLAAGWVQVRWSSWYGDETMYDHVQEDDFTMGAAFMEGLPLEVM